MAAAVERLRFEDRGPMVELVVGVENKRGAGQMLSVNAGVEWTVVNTRVTVRPASFDEEAGSLRPRAPAQIKNPAVMKNLRIRDVIVTWCGSQAGQVFQSVCFACLLLRFERRCVCRLRVARLPRVFCFRNGDV
jgi:hypothetical protein